MLHTATHIRYYTSVNMGIKTTQNNSSLKAIILFYSNLRHNIFRMQVKSQVLLGMIQGLEAIGEMFNGMF